MLPLLLEEFIILKHFHKIIPILTLIFLITAQITMEMIQLNYQIKYE